MKNRKYYLSVFLLVFLHNISFSFQFERVPRNNQFLINAKSELYDDLFLLFSEQKKTPLVVSRPATISQFRFWLSEIEYEALSEAGKEIFNKIESEIGKESRGGHTGAIKIGLDGFVNPEFYVKTNENIPWVHNYFERPAFLNIPIYLGGGKFLAAEVDLPLVQEYDVSVKHSNWKNFPYDFSKGINVFNALYSECEWTIPKVGYVSLGTNFGQTPSGINFYFGRSPLSIGNSIMKSVIFSQNFEVDWVGKFTVFAPGIKYSIECEQVGDLEIDGEKTHSYLYLHSIHARPFKWIQVGMIEGVFVSAPFELRYFNPMMIMHQFSYWSKYPGDDYSHVCGYMAFTFELSPFKNFRLYGLWAQTENQTSSEKESKYGKTVPQGFAAQLGVNLKFDTIWLGGSYWSVNVEGVYASPWVYLRQTRGGSLVKDLDGAADLIGIGSPEGPDSIVAQLTIAYKVPSKWEVKMAYRFSAKGENYFSDETIKKYPGYFGEDGKETEDGGASISEREKIASCIAPSGIPAFTNRLSISGKYIFSRIFELGLSTAFSLVTNTKNKEGEKDFCFEAALLGRIKFF